MSVPAAITGDYTDLRFVKGRKVAQIVIEIPIEAAGGFVEAFGTPLPDKSVPVALARLVAQEQRSATLKKQLKDSVALEDKPKGGRLAKQAGILCATPTFWRYCHEQLAGGLEIVESAASAAILLRTECGVSSRRELDHNEEAAAKFRQLDREFVAWCSE